MINPHHSQDVYWHPGALRREMGRVLDICHGCRRCWNVCPTFVNAFKRIDQLEEELNGPTAPSSAAAGVYSDEGHAAAIDPSLAKTKDPVAALSDDDHRRAVDECYQCKLCFNLCPYHPPHRFQLDFPRLMQRYRAVDFKAGRWRWRDRLLARADLVGTLSCLAAPLVNALNAWRPWRRLLRLLLGIHPDRLLPSFASRTFRQWWEARRPSPRDRKAVLFYTCTVNYNEPRTGRAAVAALERNGLEALCPPQECCGMPHLDAGDLEAAKAAARRNVARLLPHAKAGTPIVALGPTCSYMLKQEYPALLGGEDAELVARRTFDVSEYLLGLKKEGRLDLDLKPFEGKIAYQAACHLKAQNIGLKGRELLSLIPGAEVSAVDRCSAHDGTWSMKEEYFELSMKYARKLFDELAAADVKAVATDCPLAGVQIRQGTGRAAVHPVELLARAYGWHED